MIEGGRIAEPASHGITEQLKSLSFSAERMKTGTPVRIDGRSVKWELTVPQELEEDFHKFSYLPDVKRGLKQRRCFTVSQAKRLMRYCAADFRIHPFTTVRFRVSVPAIARR